ncbi:MAG: P63C domain-containing protein [Nitrospirota bacterium]|nr:P63C domain-containing protein [Nitrospirota bacterium]
MNKSIQTVSHYGIVRFGDLECEAVVLLDGERGYVQRQLAAALGMHRNNPSNRFRQILAELAPNALIEWEKKESPILLPGGQKARFFPVGIVTQIASGVVNAAIDGTLHGARRVMVPRCMQILNALATTGEVALIDEATGYQYHRAPDALQALIGKLLRQDAASWERRFQPDYYGALFRLFGWRYQGHVQNPPRVIGQITLRWVYTPVLPAELIDEIRQRKEISDKHHQWLTEVGLTHLEQQIHSVTAIARCSANYRDFDRRCAAAFEGSALQLGLIPELEEVA